MAAVDPYAPCPCGSGEKFKWCCHKIEAIADRAQRLYDGHQIEAVLAEAVRAGAVRGEPVRGEGGLGQDLRARARRLR